MSGGDPLGPVLITARDVYDVVVATRDQVGRLVDQVGDVKGDVVDHETRLRRLEDVRPQPRIASLEERLRGVEARLWPLPALALLMSAGSVALTVVTLMGK